MNDYSPHADIAARYLNGPEAWTAVSFSNSWADVGGANQVAEYRKDGDVVTLRGAIDSGTSGTTAFTLPTGYRPPATNNFAVVAGGGGGSIARLVVTAAGLVQPTDVGSSDVNASVWLSGVSFSVTT